MSGTSRNDFQNGALNYLDPNQQDLLLAALASNGQNINDLGLNSQQFNYPVDLNQNFFASPQQSTPATGFSNVGIEESPFADYLDGDNSFDFDGDNGDLMIGALPGDSPNKGDESSEKRKNPDDEGDDIEGGGKRREGEDKQAKKPGRKPLTSEPTTVRLL